MDLEIRLPSETPQVGVEIKFAATVSSKGVVISDAPRLASTWLRVSEVLPVGCSDAYIPTKEDIGHRLRNTGSSSPRYNIKNVIDFIRDFIPSGDAFLLGQYDIV